jgi:hypothetical protein
VYHRLVIFNQLVNSKNWKVTLNTKNPLPISTDFMENLCLVDRKSFILLMKRISSFEYISIFLFVCYVDILPLFLTCVQQISFLQGSSLKNTEMIYGLVLYTGISLHFTLISYHNSHWFRDFIFCCLWFFSCLGPDTKLALNQKGAPSKFSHVERRLNRYVVWIFACMIILCLTAAGLSYAWTVSEFLSHIYQHTIAIEY